MDWISYGSRGMDFVKKYRYILLLVALGILFMTFPEDASSEKPVVDVPSEQTVLSLEESLAKLLAKLDGAGKVEVLLTQARGEETLYQTDSRQSHGGESRDLEANTVLIRDPERREAGLIRQVNPPEYLGAVILCQGADKAAVRLAVVEAVMDITGLTSDKITVLRMK